MTALFHVAGRQPEMLSIVRPVRILSAGNHHPLLCEMSDASGAIGQWVVKPCIVVSRSTERSTFATLAELAGAEVCTWAGVLSPRTGLTRFPRVLEASALREAMPTLEQAEREEIVETFRLNQGRLGFCALHLLGAADLRPKLLRARRWRATAIPDAVALLVADAFMRHDDRVIENPNALWYADRVVAIDHGSAFGLLQRTGTSGDDLARQVALHPSLASHVAFGAVKRYAMDAHWDVVMSRFEAVPAGHAAELLSKCPAELDQDPMCGQRELRSRMVRFLDERQRRVRELVGVLRGAVRTRA